MNAASSPNDAPPDVPETASRRTAAPAAVPSVPRGEPAIGGIVPYSSVDWPGMLAAVVFISGCPWRCSYCHNPHLQRRSGHYDWKAVLEFLNGRRGLLDAVVFSGGEPLSEPRLPQMVRAVRALGFRVALHTAGIYPSRLHDLLAHLDWVGFDVKADAAGHDALTGRPDTYAATQACLESLLASGIPFECRTTWSPRWLTEPALVDLARDLARRGVRHYAVQNHRASPEAPPSAVLSATTLAELQALFSCFAYR
ncbi:anaerobic ribonucleoside-triphosphate reductase activating protein [Bordetella sp. BOR01]|uniref:anaerobic ribonucleoside-triphosphate reductase activating protein n=1 Tax=Bordetella sp. BOR01 TaxID=2854779 RepID=UPI001C468E81|nr:anaerobic ribonucleoside-triphosphate reductase activating protein [Bordetella sp. BOR01]MBV7487000.1 anaerobic ribonucleoside-triphosphate reductase activating protein [Bordetella sp. BOR01]